MKNCDEMVNSLLERKVRYDDEQKRKRKIIARTASSLCCVCLVVLMGVVVWQSGAFNAEPQDTPDNFTVNGNKASIDSADNTNQQPNKDMSGVIPSPRDNPSSDGELGQDSLVDWKGNIISDYGTGTAMSYKTPDNNTFGISIPLRSAIEEYGDTARYMVVVDIFKDKEQIVTDESLLEAEMKRLEGLGYEAAIEVNDLGEEPIYYFCIQATKEQLENFDCNKEYGYFFFGRSERID